MAIACYVTDRKSLASGEGGDPVAILPEKIRAAIRAGVDWAHIREKDLAGKQLLMLVRGSVTAAREIAQLEPRRETQIYVNDRLDVALAAAAAGIHLGGESLPIADVVRWCNEGNAPSQFKIGLSCHSIETAREAEHGGANYIFFGPIFETPSKRSFGPPQGIERLRQVCGAVRIPVIAIGGLNESNAEQCIRAGAAGIAGIRLFQDTASAESLADFISRMHDQP